MILKAYIWPLFKSQILLLILISFICTPLISNAQEIDFGSYNNYSVSVSEFNPAVPLSFGQILRNEGTVNISLEESKVLLIDGVKYLDIYVDITADPKLLLNGDGNCSINPSCSIPFTLQVAYANRGTNSTAEANLMNVSSNVASARFPILQRGNRPAGPPPTPVYEGYNPAAHTETAYLYLYGSINVGNIDAGSYTADITVTVTYE